MAAVASSIKFVQGANIGTIGQALIGIAGTSVTASNGNNANVSNWTYVVLDAPPGSAVPLGVVQSGAVSTWSFTPDVSGSYLIQLIVSDGLAIPTTATDSRSFGVLRASGKLMPPFIGDSGSMNFGGNLRGWAKYMEQWLTAIDALFVPTGTGIPHVVGGVMVAASSLIVLTADVTGVLPVANQANQTMTGDVTGNTGASVVSKINGAVVSVIGAAIVGNGLYLSSIAGAGSLAYSSLNLAGGAGWVSGALPSLNGGTGLIALGAGLQVLRTNAGGTAMEWSTAGGVTWANDLAGSTSTTQTVVALTSAAVIPVTTALSFGALPSLTGVIRLASTKAITSRSTGGADLNVATYNGSDQFLLGDPAAATVFLSSGGGMALRGVNLIIQPVSGAINAWTFSGLASGATALTVDASLLTPTITQAAAVAAQTPANFTVAPQTFNAGSTTLLANTPGSFVVNVTAPGTLTVAGAEAGLVVQRAGTAIAKVAVHSAASTRGMIWLGGHAAAPTLLNYAIVSDNAAVFTQINTPVFGSVYLSINNATSFAVSGATAYTATGISLGVNGTPSLGGGVGVLGMLDAATASTSNPVGGLILSSLAGGLALRTAAGANALTLDAAMTTAVFTQAPTAVASATGAQMSVLAQSASGATSTGGTLKLQSGTGTTAPGSIQMFSGATEQLRIEAGGVALNGPGSYGGGVGVLCLMNASTLPTSSPTGGSILYADSGVNPGSFRVRGGGNIITTLAAGCATSTAVQKRHIREELETTLSVGGVGVVWTCPTLTSGQSISGKLRCRANLNGGNESAWQEMGFSFMFGETVLQALQLWTATQWAGSAITSLALSASAVASNSFTITATAGKGSPYPTWSTVEYDIYSTA